MHNFPSGCAPVTDEVTMRVNSEMQPLQPNTLECVEETQPQRGGLCGGS